MPAAGNEAAATSFDEASSFAMGAGGAGGGGTALSATLAARASVEPACVAVRAAAAATTGAGAAGLPASGFGMVSGLATGAAFARDSGFASVLGGLAAGRV